jgi:hypothetical protein
VPDYYEQARKALVRQRAREDSKKALDDRAAARMPASTLTIADIAEAVADIVKTERREILQHVGRMLKLIEIKQPSEDVRARNLHRRVTQIESELRLLQKGKR